MGPLNNQGCLIDKHPEERCARIGPDALIFQMFFLRKPAWIIPDAQAGNSHYLLTRLKRNKAQRASIDLLRRCRMDKDVRGHPYL